MSTPIDGRCAPAFAAVRQAFETNFAERGEVGAAVHVIVDGEVVVDLVDRLVDRHQLGTEVLDKLQQLRCRIRQDGFWHEGHLLVSGPGQ